MKCVVCKVEADEEFRCEVCGSEVCAAHYEMEEETLKCDYCLGKRSPFDDRDEDDFAGTEM